MTVPAWECKRGDDFYAPAPIVVKVGGVRQDLTDEAWDLAIKGRANANDAEAAFEATWDTDSELLAEGEVWLIIDRADTENLSGEYVVDLQATNDDLPKVKRKTSATWTITFVDDVTWTAPEVGS